MFQVEFYEDDNGSSPAYDFVMGLENRKLQAKVVGSLEVLSEKGNALREPYSKHLSDGIFELRCKVPPTSSGCCISSTRESSSL